MSNTAVIGGEKAAKFEKFMEYMDVGSDTKAVQAPIAEIAVNRLSEALDYAYGQSACVPELAGLLGSPEKLAAVKANNAKRWTPVLKGDIGPELFELTLSEGNDSNKGGVDPRWHIGNYGLILGRLIKGLVQDTYPKKSLFGRTKIDAESLGDALESMIRSIFLDIDVVLDLYGDRTRQAQAEELNERNADMERIRSIFGNALSHIANRDLRHRITEDLPEEFRELGSNFNNAAQQLATIIAEIDAATANIRSGSREIATAAGNLSGRTEQQAASIEETAAALEEITTTVNESATRAADAGNLVSTAKDNAVHSGEVVRSAIEAMSEISQSSNEISSIIGVIDEIAFQTNLLALNAGVEAARAGEAGKGFAVVAQEVRELAQRSAQAAREIKELITKSADQVKNGVDLVGETGKALETIAGQVQEINTNIVAIVDGAREQAIGLKEINTAVNQMDQGTQQNAAMVEQTTAATRVLTDEIERVAAKLQEFRTGMRGERQGAQAAQVASSAPKTSTARATSPANPSAPAVKTKLKPVTADTKPSKFATRAPAPMRQQESIAKAFNAKPSSDGDWEEF